MFDVVHHAVAAVLVFIHALVTDLVSAGKDVGPNKIVARPKRAVEAEVPSIGAHLSSVLGSHKSRPHDYRLGSLVIGHQPPFFVCVAKYRVDRHGKISTSPISRRVFATSLLRAS
jgi:hypothetical protein